jgi:hypothetical protein
LTFNTFGIFNTILILFAITSSLVDTFSILIYSFCADAFSVFGSSSLVTLLESMFIAISINIAVLSLSSACSIVEFDLASRAQANARGQLSYASVGKALIPTDDASFSGLFAALSGWS